MSTQQTDALQCAADLEAQLEAIGAGGVSGPLIGQPQAVPDLSALTERGAQAWAGVDAQGLRAGFSIPPRGPDYPHRDTLENMNPACPPCNIDKHSFTLDGWRELMQRSNEVLMRDVSTFRRAVRYGLVTLNAEPIVFYFEKLATQVAAKEGAQQG